MTNLKQKPETAWNVLFACSIVGILVAGWFLAHPPAPVANGTAVEAGITRAANAASAQVADFEAKAAARTWNLNPEALGSHTLAEMTKLSEANHLQLTGLVSDKPKPVAHLVEVPFVARLEGSFPNVASFVRKIEAPDSKYAVHLVQMTVSGAGGDQVAATIGFYGYLLSGGRK